MSYNSIAIIPARGGSKRIPRKNVKLFCGVPMIARTIRMLLATNLFDSVYVSTDDEEIAAISIEAGATIPFLRSKMLADDYVPTVPVIADCIRRLNEIDAIELVCCVYPCSPMITKNDLLLGLSWLRKSQSSFSYPVIKYPHPIQRRLTINNLGKVKFSEPEHELARTQDLEDYFHDSGQFYWGKKSAWLSEKKMHSDGIGFEIDKLSAVDIDHESDWAIAEAIYENRNRKACDE